MIVLLEVNALNEGDHNVYFFKLTNFSSKFIT